MDGQNGGTAGEVVREMSFGPAHGSASGFALVQGCVSCDGKVCVVNFL